MLTEKELQVFTHKLTNMLSFNNEEMNEIKKMNSKELLVLVIVLNDMYEFILNLLEEELFSKED